MRALGHEYFHHDADSQTLMGADTGLVIAIGDKVEVRLAEAVPVTGGLTLELVGFEARRCRNAPDAPVPGAHHDARRANPRRSA
jgi:ribonuclease R